MILNTGKLSSTYYRTRNGVEHKCYTTQTVYTLRCDNCNEEFTRTSKVFDHRSTSHVCGNCDQKKFAQRQSAIYRLYNKWDASSTKRI